MVEEGQALALEVPTGDWILNAALCPNTYIIKLSTRANVSHTLRERYRVNTFNVAKQNKTTTNL